MTDTLRLPSLSPVACPVCGQRYSAGSRFCPFDGEELVDIVWDPDADPLLGKVIEDRYQVESVLGEGGMGKVYAVRHLRLDRPFAIKVLRAELARDASLAERFILEAKATAAINHPSIITISDFGVTPDGAPYFAMELLEGQTLHQLLRAGGPIPAKRAVGIAVNIAAALQAAHESGVVHRDLKPENIFLAQFSGREEVKVVDFGASRLLGASRITRTGVIFGTPHYMSPEQASGVDVDHRADIYAFGIILYEMFTGKVPFEAETFMGVITQQMVAKPVPPSQVHPLARDLGVLEDITLKCLEKRPADRFESMEALRRALVAAASGGARPAMKSASSRNELASELELPSLSEIRRRSEEPPFLPRNRKPLFILGAVSMVLGAALVWAVSTNRPGVGTASSPSSSTAAATLSVPPAASSIAPLVSSGTSVPPLVRTVHVTANVPGDVFRGTEKVGAVPLDLPVKDGKTSYEFRTPGGKMKAFVIDESSGHNLELTISPGVRASAVDVPASKPSSVPQSPPTGGGDTEEDRLLQRLRKRVP